MSNKLKDVFTNKMVEMGGNLHFKDTEAKYAFLNALKIVGDSGNPVKVSGISSVSTHVKDGGMMYPLMIEGETTDVVIYPSIDTVPITLSTIYGEKTVNFQRYNTSNGVVLETGQNDIVFLKFIFSKDGHNVTFNYRMQSQYAKHASDVVENYNIALEVLEFFFKSDESMNTAESNELLRKMKESFKVTLSFWKKLNSIENELSISFDPTKIGSIDDSIKDVEELYLLLVENKAIRLDGKLTSTESTGITFVSDAKTPDIGHAIELTFTGESVCSICDQDITIYTANLLTNAIIKEIVKNEDGTTRVLYGDTDSIPMYISYCGFKTPEEADSEYKLIMSKEELKEKYLGALTLTGYITQK